ncbi:major intrinsic protein superfamily membrane channel protein [Hysterangium stoloniferum]|nr:major intrinsic protein superfamily membrane channel protein [Hysterangium stoloniferum]
MSHDISNDSTASDENRTMSPSSHRGVEGGKTLEELTEHCVMYPNIWAQWRGMIREPAAEFLGTMVLILFGNGVVVLAENPAISARSKGEYLSISFGWGTAAALGVWISGGISGGHINPAITLALAVFRGFPWKKVPIYMFAQLMGAICGAAIVYANYFHAIDIFEGERGVRTVPGTASLFATYPLDYLTPVSAFFDEVIGTALLVMVVFAVTDKKNLAPKPGMLPLAIFFAVFGIGLSFGMQTGYAINPARDFGPRLLTAMVGYGRDVFNFRNQYWLWCPILGPFLGALVGALVYDTFLFIGNDSIINTANLETKAHRERVRNVAAEKTAGDIV